MLLKLKQDLGSGCGSVGRAVASDTIDPRFESRHRQNLIYHLYNRKDENKEKRGWEWPIFKKIKTGPKLNSRRVVGCLIDNVLIETMF